MNFTETKILTIKLVNGDIKEYDLENVNLNSINDSIKDTNVDNYFDIDKLAPIQDFSL